VRCELGAPGRRVGPAARGTALRTARRRGCRRHVASRDRFRRPGALVQDVNGVDLPQLRQLLSGGCT
jgi:hypothetical protein